MQVKILLQSQAYQYELKLQTLDAEAMLGLACFSALIWLITLCLPWKPWKNGEVLNLTNTDLDVDLSQITVLIPARNEADVIKTTLLALERQGQNLNIIVIDDESTDNTAETARQSAVNGLNIIQSELLPNDWTGKLWAQQQGLEHVHTPYTLLLDADIELLPGTLISVFHKLKNEDLSFVSLMAKLRFASFWEQLLLPAFILFFKMLYPFKLSNDNTSNIAAAAGGFILVDTQALKEIGGMAAIKNAIIDDCSLAKKIKSAGYKTWIGLTHTAISRRPYSNLKEIWEMVARTAFTQLNYSIVLLIACTVIMIVMYWIPVLGVFLWHGWAFWLSVLSFFALSLTYIPTLRFYALNPIWAIFMPIISGFYLIMTWSSASRYWRGERSRWKGRIYQNA